MPAAVTWLPMHVATALQGAGAHGQPHGHVHPSGQVGASAPQNQAGLAYLASRGQCWLKKKRDERTWRPSRQPGVEEPSVGHVWDPSVPLACSKTSVAVYGRISVIRGQRRAHERNVSPFVYVGYAAAFLWEAGS